MKSDLLGIDLQEELAAIRLHKAGQKKLKTKKLKPPSSPDVIRHRLGLTQDTLCRTAGRICANAQELGTGYAGTTRPSLSIAQDRGEKPGGVV